MGEHEANGALCRNCNYRQAMALSELSRKIEVMSDALKEISLVRCDECCDNIARTALIEVGKGD